MTESITLQALLSAYPPTLGQQPLSQQKRKVCAHIQACRTPLMGGLNLQCDHCDYSAQQYHSCRDRHCPQCQYRQREQWCQRQQAQVLPVAYHHVVFTLPHALNGWVELHPRVIYRLLFHTVWETLNRFGQDPRHLGGQLGMTAVLHTWGQNLSRHVHLHCLLPAGALDKDKHWKAAKSHYLFPVRALSKVFQGKMVSALRLAHSSGELSRITHPGEINQTLNDLMTKDWVVYSRHCLTKTHSVIDYLGRYSHRIALTNARLQGLHQGKVQLRYKDYRDNQRKVMALDPQELIRRFLLHVLPKGFMRIRHYGFLANCCREKRLSTIRKLLSKPEAVADTEEKVKQPGIVLMTQTLVCPKCKTGQLQVTGEIDVARLSTG
jgi:hypothetical protein